MSSAKDAERDPPTTSNGIEMNAENAIHLADLVAQATLKYSVKDYDAAAELYSQATELQAEIHGEMSSQNADLLYAYGRCLYHVAVKNSDVLGSKVAGEKQSEPRKPRNRRLEKEQAADQVDGPSQKIADEVVANRVEDQDGPVSGDKPRDTTKPYFQFTGDENWDTSEEEIDDDADQDDGADAEEEDDFVNAYEVLDLARVLLRKKLVEVETAISEKQKSQITRQLEERLADTYDLQAEISLEGERFPNAVTDLKSALALKTSLYPQESSLLAEAHYKLSLALEFSSVTQQKGTSGETESASTAQIDESMRHEAAEQMEAAIASCKLRIHREEANLNDTTPTTVDASQPKVTKTDIEDVKEMVKEMEQRLAELRQPSMSADDLSSLSTIDDSHPLSSILGSILGETPAAQRAKLMEASESAKDLTNLVKRKRPTESETTKSAAPNVTQTNVKRKAGSVAETDEIADGKRVKTTNGDNS